MVSIFITREKADAQNNNQAKEVRVGSNVALWTTQRFQSHIGVATLAGLTIVKVTKS